MELLGWRPEYNVVAKSHGNSSVVNAPKVMSDVYGQAEAIKQIEAELGATCRWNTTTLPCIISERGESKDLGYGGFATETDVSVVIRKALFGASGPFPAPKDLVILPDRTLNVQTVTHAPDGSVVVLACNDPTRGV